MKDEREKQRLELEQKEDRDDKKTWTLRELIEKSGGVFDNPMLLEIIKAAPSPKAADQHIRSLGWPNDLAKEVRCAVRLKQQFPEHWPVVETSNVRPADSLFDFSGETPFGLLRSTKFQFDKWENDTSNWPLLTNEFALKREGKIIFSTFDGRNESYNSRIPHRAKNFSRVELFYFTHGQSFFDSRFANSGLESGFKNGGIEVFNEGWAIDMMRKFSSRILGWSAMVEPEPVKRIFPSFYKAIEIRAPFANEEIRILLRQDFGPLAYKNDNHFRCRCGEVIFEKRVPISQDRTEVRLSLKYEIDFDFPGFVCRRPNYDNEEALIAVHFVNNGNGWREEPRNGQMIALLPIRPGQDFDQRKIAGASEELAVLAAKIYSGPNEIPLEKIAGLAFLEDPPERLADLFC